jgi:8-oxo-dGTP pyrophosphatase MutT (NUDIX family)
MRVAGCFLEHQGKFVILYRHSHKPDGDTWGLPGGKVEQGESDEAAILRELAEETGYKASDSELEHIGDFDFVSPRGTPYTYVTFRVALGREHSVQLERSAHAEYRWVTAEECDALPNLITDFDTLLRLTGHIQR